jgi:ABC-type amino acid transport substrate-binding protein
VPRALLVSLAATACVVAPVTAVAGVHSPVRVAATMLLFCLAPGAALLPLLTPRATGVELGLVVGFSLAVCALVAQSMLWLGAWSPVGATCLLAAACLVPIAGQLTEMRWQR